MHYSAELIVLDREYSEYTVKMKVESTVFVSGIFNVLHPGHIRIFQFARALGEQLFVAVDSDRIAGNAAHVKEELRLESVKSFSLIDIFIFDEPVVELIGRLRRYVVLKGREYERGYNPEAEGIAAHGGRPLFSSGGNPVFLNRSFAIGAN